MDARSSNSLVVEFDNSEPLPLAAVSRVLDALSRDYRQTYRRDLLVNEIRTGSIILSLVDWASQANELIEFGIHIAELTAAAVAGVVYLRGRRRRGARTVLALVELAAETGTETRINYTGPDGEQVLVHMTPSKAHLIEEHANAESDLPVALPAPPAVELALEDFAKAAALRLENAGATDNEADDGLFVLIRELIQALRRTPKGRASLTRIKARLVAGGFSKAAVILDE